MPADRGVTTQLAAEEDNVQVVERLNHEVGFPVVDPQARPQTRNGRVYHRVDPRAGMEEVFQVGSSAGAGMLGARRAVGTKGALVEIVLIAWIGRPSKCGYALAQTPLVLISSIRCFIPTPIHLLRVFGSLEWNVGRVDMGRRCICRTIGNKISEVRERICL